MATKRRTAITIQAHHFDVLQAAKHAVLAEQKAVDSGEAPTESDGDLDARLAMIRHCIRASRSLRTKLGADTKLPVACDARNAATVADYEAVRAAFVTACKA